ncbi:MAG: acyl carrier protein [Xanthobacteraceae bacterium]
MIYQNLERLVLDVVLSNVDDEVVRDLNSGVAVLDVDHLTMTYIVLALENRLGVELPTHLEDARTIADLVSGVLHAVQAKSDMKCQVALDLGVSQSRTTAPIAVSCVNPCSALTPSRPRRKKLTHRGARLQ